MQITPFVLTALLSLNLVFANWHAESTNASLPPLLLRSKTLNLRGRSGFALPLQRRQSCNIGFTTCGEGCCKTGTFCCEDKEGCCPMGYECTPGGCCPILKTCGGFKECPTDPTLAQCAGGEGCCPPGVLCVHDNSGGTRCEGDPSPPSSSSDIPAPTSTIVDETSTDDINLPTISPPSDGSFPTFTSPPLPSGPFSGGGDDGNGDNGGAGLGGLNAAPLLRTSVALLLVSMVVVRL